MSVTSSIADIPHSNFRVRFVPRAVVPSGEQSSHLNAEAIALLTGSAYDAEKGQRLNGAYPDDRHRTLSDPADR
jgi:hypothetical protein